MAGKRETKKVVKQIALELAISMIEMQRKNPSDLAFDVSGEYGVEWLDVRDLVTSELASIIRKLQAQKRPTPTPPTESEATDGKQ